MTVDDTQLLRRIAERDRQAFSQFYDRYATLLYSTVLRALNHREDAGEVMQQVFGDIWRKAGSYDSAVSRPFNWVLTLTRQKVIDRLRAEGRRYSFVEEAAAESKSDTRFFDRGSAEILGQEHAGQIRKAVDALPLEQRQAIEMAFLGGMTQNEISASLRQPLGTIKARIRRGLLKLRETVKDRL